MGPNEYYLCKNVIHFSGTKRHNIDDIGTIDCIAIMLNLHIELVRSTK